VTGLPWRFLGGFIILPSMKDMTEKTDACQSLERLLAVMARLRDPEGGCPWDLVQDFASIAPYTIEEAYEVADAIERDDMTALKEELGDLLLQVVFHSRMAEENGAFDFADVAKTISDKMVRRHPHVFGELSIEGATAQSRAWEDIKAAERAEKADGKGGGLLANVPLALPASTRAEKLQKRAARVGFDWPDVAQVFDKIDEEIAEIKQEIQNRSGQDRLQDELGDLLFAVVNLGRHLGVDPERALRGTNRKFERRFHVIEETFGPGLEAASLEEMEAAWKAAKEKETDAGEDKTLP
jgi:ATP diphosphatase